MKYTRCTVIRKIRIVEHAQTSPSLKATARMFHVQPSQIRRWRKNIEFLRSKAISNPKARTVCTGPTPMHPELESAIYDWVISRRAVDHAVSTNEIKCKAKSIDSNFKNGSEEKIDHWVYDFLKRYNLTVRMSTHIGQMITGHMDTVARDFSRRVMTTFQNRIQNGKFFCNMDETAIYFNCKPKRTVHTKGDRTISIRIGSGTGVRCTLCVTVAYDGTKLPLFIIFKGVPRGSVEQSLQSTLPDGVYGCAQKNAWIDERSMALWYEKVWKPHTDGRAHASMLLLDSHKCHTQQSLMSKLQKSHTLAPIVPSGYTYKLQPCDVGINRPLKSRLQHLANQWRVEQYANLGPLEKAPSPGRAEISIWLKKVWDELPSSIVENSFRGSGFIYEEGPRYDLDTESDDSSEESE